MIQYIKGKTCYQLRFNVKLHASYHSALQPPRPWVTPVLQAKYSLYIIYQNHFLKILTLSATGDTGRHPPSLPPYERRSQST